MKDRRATRLPLAPAALLAATAGLVQLALFFSDHGGGPAAWPVVAASAVLASAVGALMGALRPAGWPLLGTLACWGALVSGLVFLASGEHEGVVPLVLPLAAGLASSWAGARRRRAAPACDRE